ncbi:MAG: hypothetical protein ACPLWB_02910 [Caldisericia bacterium]
MVNFIISDYIVVSMKKAVYDKLRDETFLEKIQECKDVVAFGKSNALSFIKN